MRATWNTTTGARLDRVLAGRSNVYLISAGKIRMLVDTGMRFSFLKLGRELKTLHMGIEDLTHLVLTHTHFDHCQSAMKIKELSGVKVIVSGHADGFIKQGYTPLPEGTWWWSKLLVEVGRNFGKHGFGYAPFASDIRVEKELLITAGSTTIKIIETGGHSIDSVCIIVDDEIALVGDEMFGVFRRSIMPPFADNATQMFNTWQTLLDTGCSRFLPGHGKELNRDIVMRVSKRSMHLTHKQEEDDQVKKEADELYDNRPIV